MDNVRVGNGTIVVGEFNKPSRSILLYVAIVFLMLSTLASLFIAVRNAKPVCEAVESRTVGIQHTNYCVYDLGSQYKQSDYILVHN